MKIALPKLQLKIPFAPDVSYYDKDSHNDNEATHGYLITPSQVEQIIEALKACEVIAHASISVMPANQDIEKDRELANLAEELLRAHRSSITKALSILIEDEK